MNLFKDRIQDNYKNVIDYSFVFIILIYLANATRFVRDFATWENPIALAIPLVFTGLFVLARNLSFSKPFIILISGYLVYFVISTLKFGELHPRFFGIYLFDLLIGYVLFAGLRYKLYKIYEDLLFILCLIGIFLWLLQQYNFEEFSNIFSHIAFSEPGSQNVNFNFIIYTVSDIVLFKQYIVEIGSLTLNRNAGFAWEPGAFACFINLAIYCNLIRYNFSIQKNPRFWVLLIALITTFSTTGYAIFLVLMMLYMYNKQMKYVIAFSPIVIIALLYISTLPFMIDKLVNISEFNTEEMVMRSARNKTLQTPQRFESFLIDFVDFKNNPIIGYGGHDDARWTKKLGAKVATISGIGNLMAVFGSVGLLFFLISLIYTSRLNARIFNYKGWGFHFLMILMISISYGILFNSIILCFWLYNINYLPQTEKLKMQNTNRFKK